MNTEVLSLGIETGGMLSGLKKSGAATKKFGSTFQSTMKRNSLATAKLGAQLTALSLPALLFAKKSIGGFIEFDKAIVNSQSIMSGVTDEIDKKMRAAARSISTTLPVSAALAAGSFYFLASAGLNAEQSIAALSTVARFSVAGMFDMAKATDLLTDAQVALGMSSLDPATNLANMARVADIAARSSQLSNDTIQGFSEMLTADAASSMKSYNIGLENGVSVLTAYAAAGKKASEAGNLFGRMTRLLAGAAIDNADAFEEMKIKVFDGQGNFKNFSDIIGDLERALEGMGAKQTTIALKQLGFSKLTQKSILPLIGLSEAMAGFRTELENSEGALKTVTDKQLKSFSAQIQIAKNLFQNFADSIAEANSGPMAKVVSVVQGILKSFQDLSPRTKTIIASVIALAAVMGPLLIAIAGVQLGFGILAGAVGALFSPVLILVGLFIGLGIVVYKMWDQIKPTWDAMIEYITGPLTFVWLGLKYTVEDIAGRLKFLFTDYVGPSLVSAFKFIAKGIMSMGDIFNIVIGGVMVLFHSFKMVVVAIVESVAWYIETLAKVWHAYWTGMQGVVKGVATGVLYLAEGIMKSLNWLIQELSDLIAKVPEWVPGTEKVRAFSDAVSGGMQGATDKVEGLRKALGKDAIDTFKDAGAEFSNAFGKADFSQTKAEMEKIKENADKMGSAAFNISETFTTEFKLDIPVIKPEVDASKVKDGIKDAIEDGAGAATPESNLTGLNRNAASLAIAGSAAAFEAEIRTGNSDSEVEKNTKKTADELARQTKMMEKASRAKNDISLVTGEAT